MTEGIDLTIQDSIFVNLIWIHGSTFRYFCGKGVEHKFFFCTIIGGLFSQVDLI